MSAASDESEYAHGFSAGYRAFDPARAQPYHPDHNHGFRYETGFADGWGYRAAHAAERLADWRALAREALVPKDAPRGLL